MAPPHAPVVHEWKDAEAGHQAPDRSAVCVAASATRDVGEGFGPHLVMDGYGCPSGRLEDVERIRALLESLPERIGLTQIAPPCVLRHPAKGRGGDGVSGFVLAGESHVAVHTFPGRHFLNVDVFSCGAFDIGVALAALKESFAPRRVEWKLLDRGFGFPKAVGPVRSTVLQSRALLARNLGLGVPR